MRRRFLTACLTLLSSMALSVSAAQAIVVSDQGSSVGVALVPGTKLPSAITPLTSSSACNDPALPSDLVLPNTGLCFHGGSVLHQNETFAVTWDPVRRYWQSTRNYLEQYLSDVASASGSLGSPYAVATQYTDATGRAGNSSLYGGGCVDYGNPGGFTCDFGDTTGAGMGNNYDLAHGAANACTPSGASDICLTDAQLQAELQSIVTETKLQGRVKAGYTPLLVLLTPPHVETCVDASATLCSSNSDAKSVPAQFCSYHSQVNVGGTLLTYVVQPFTAGTACDEPKLPNPASSDPAIDAGIRLVSPLSAGQLAAITWYALDGSEINDNQGCQPLGPDSDTISISSSSQNPYVLQPEFNNAGVIESDPNAPECSHAVALTPKFVVPSAVNHGDVVQFDGSTTVSSLIVPKLSYAWDFGDGTTAVGPSVVHTYSLGGTYAVKLTVTDRGGNAATLTQTLVVAGPTPPPPPAPPPPAPPAPPPFVAHLQLVPQSLSSMLHGGIALRVSSNQDADGIATLSITRGAARRAHIHTGQGPDVVIGRGTVSGIKNGSVQLHLRLSSVTAAKLRRLGHVTVTIRLALVASSHVTTTVVVAGSY